MPSGWGYTGNPVTITTTCHLCRLLSSDPDDQSRLDMEVLKFRKQAYATSTKATYKSQLRACVTFCTYYGYQPLPASTITLSRYAAFLAHSLSASSIPAYLNIVRIWNMAWKTLPRITSTWQQPCVVYISAKAAQSHRNNP